MKVFVSSLIGGYEPFRAAVVEAAQVLGHEVIRAEDFSASTASPQQACLAAVRASDVVVLLLGERYGFTQPSGLSATHEEYREARERKPVLVFVESGVTREAQQEAFLGEVQAWATGHFRGTYTSPADLKEGALKALHNHELATAAGPVDEGEMLGRARALLPTRQDTGAGRPRLSFAIAGGPYQQVLRPTELQSSDLHRDIQRESLFGAHPVLDPANGTNATVSGNNLIIVQQDASLAVDSAGSICVTQPAVKNSKQGQLAIPSIIEEDITAALVAAAAFASWLLERIDPLRRISGVVPIVALSGANYTPWRTRAEQQASPNQAQMSNAKDLIVVRLEPARRHRQALSHDSAHMVEDLVALLRSEVRGGRG